MNKRCKSAPAAAKKAITALISVAAAALLTAFIALICWGNTALELNRYLIASSRLPQAFDGFTIAHVSDLHNAEMGENNKDLLSLLQEAEPDLIAITGDLINSRRTDTETALTFARAAAAIAPCYYVTGNHEARVPAYAAFSRALEEAGVTVLANEHVTLERNGESITLLGVDDPSFGVNDDKFGTDGEKDRMRAQLKTLMEKADGFTLLLSHRPELIGIYQEFGIDLVLAGHAHGGQFRLPFLGGLYAPDQGFFPRYDAGLFQEGNTSMLVSRGIGNSIFPFRINNRPEVILAELQCK